ncbi:AAA family ATPase (plasmid) [Priestia megaterium]|uniref:AAA family ATPase n=1 Tax=Priestia megaterium TaxID=1404 RepID=UPI002449CF3F|nr:AAA family ATPase [Priestia megaterium]MDH2449037.1 AAA family ATPase [Priestia megaterium]MDL5148495.1 AAA family ATPase [Priestia megaterium]
MCRIVIFGNSCAGKTTLATSLGKDLMIPVYHLDLWFRDKNMQRIKQLRRRRRKFRRQLDKVVEKKEWIIEGWGYFETYDIRFEKADVIIFLDLSPEECKKRLMNRENYRKKDGTVDKRTLNNHLHKIDKFHQTNRLLILELFQKYEGTYEKTLFPIVKKFNYDQLMTALKNIVS